VLAATVHGVRVIDVYCPNGQAVGSDKYAYKLAWYAALAAYVRQELARHAQLVVLGDFNVAPADEDVHDVSEWEGQILFSEPEKAALRAVVDTGLVDAFRRYPHPPKTFTWWDYRMNAFPRNRGLRIDHVLVSHALAEKLTACDVDLAPRKLERPSDHAPVTATFAL
jgi:exodeoxyribonuclease-3